MRNVHEGINCWWQYWSYKELNRILEPRLRFFGNLTTI